MLQNIISNIIQIFYQHHNHMDNQKSQALKIRKDKKKNTQTGLLMGQNTNIFSQLSATYLQTKSSATQQQSNFINETQIVQYHDPNINRLIAMLRKKADVTKAKAASQLREQIIKMTGQNIQQFAQTFVHLFRQIIINQQSKQIIDQFVAMMVIVLQKHKKIIIKQIATFFGPLLVINKSNNSNLNKVYNLLFTGTQQQINQKVITLLLNKNVLKKFFIFSRIIIQCEQNHKIGQQNYQRNCSSLLKVIKDFIRSYQNIGNKKQQIINNFQKFIQQINQIVSSKYVQDYFKVGGKAKSSFLQFYQTLITSAAKHPQWDINWQNYVKIICQNYLDKDSAVQQALWKHCNRQFIITSLQLQNNQSKQQGKDKQKYWLLHKYLPKPDQKLFSALKIGGIALYKQLPSYCIVFPYTCFQSTQTHKSIINKINFIRKLMQTILELQDQNQARIQCYYQLTVYFVKILRNCTTLIYQLDQKKQQQIKSLAIKAEKQIINNLQDRYYKNPPTSRNAFNYNIPEYFSKIISQIQPNFDFIFDPKETFALYGYLKKQKYSEYCTKLFNKIYDNCKNDQNLLLNYLQNCPSRHINVDMSLKNQKVEQAAKIFLLSLQSQDDQNWFKPEWDVRKKLIVFDPRITLKDLQNLQQNSNVHNFKPSLKTISNQQTLINPLHDCYRINYFLDCLESNQQQIISLITITLPLIKDIILHRNQNNKIKLLNKILQMNEQNLTRLSKKQWIVSQISVLKVRIIAELILQSLKFNEQLLQRQQIDKIKIQSFLKNYCQFVLTIYNYKLEVQSQQFLKLLTKCLHIQYISNNIFYSVQSSIKLAYSNFVKISSNKKQLLQGQQKQRKNRLNRVSNFIRKLVWYAVNKKKQQNYVFLIENILGNPDWKFAQYRPDLWVLCQVVLQTVNQKIKRKIASKIVQNIEQYKYFFGLLMCCQLILALQRYPSTKKYIIQLQSQVLKQIKQNSTDEQSFKIFNSILDEVISNQSFLLIYGVKNLLKNLMKNYQNISPQVLNKYAQLCLKRSLENLKQFDNQSLFNIKCFLIINLCTQLPLLDLPDSQKAYDLIIGTIINSKQNLQTLGYLAIIGIMWDAAIGIDKLTSQTSNILIQKLILSLKQSLTQNSAQKNNFIRFYALTFLNSFIQAKSKEEIKQFWDFILQQVVLSQIQQGSLLHSALQSARYKFISKIFSTSQKQLQAKFVLNIPQQILKQVRFYKQVLDQIQEEEKQTQTQVISSTQHYENITNMFIQFAQVLVRVTGNLSKQIKPKEEIILQLLQCPFAGIKKTSFMLLKQMYELNFVEKIPPSAFVTYLKSDPELTKTKLEPIIANKISGYLYSWQAIIQRRSTTERRPQTQQQNTISLQDYLQSEQLHESFIQTVFQLLQFQLQYSKNEQQFQISAEQLLELDTVVTIQDDHNLHNKVFRLVIRTFFMFVENFPLFLRDFVDKNKKYRIVCERLLRNIVSDAIFKQQISRIQMRQHQWKSAGNFQIYVIPKNKQIYAQYTHDVIRIGLRLVMKGNYPLTPIFIQFGQGLKIQQGSRWALMLQTQLHNRNNTIINGILLWKDNIDKKLAGVEQCAICFDIVNSNGQLPKKGCKTCKKKFHSVCIMKWFSKSNKSQCPLCKSQFL